MAIHDRAYTRTKSWTKALRKYHIDRAVSPRSLPPMYSNLHQYADNKIHCSCPMCSEKTNNKNRNGARGWEPSKNWSITDKRKLENMENQIEELDT